jgi:hypothetical protein
MIGNQRRRFLALGAVLTMVIMAGAQMQRQSEALSIQGYPGQANVIRSQGRVYVDVQDLARIANGSLSFEKDRIILTLPLRDGSQSVVGDPGSAGFSRAFMRAAIEAMASLREWGGMLLVTVKNGYPVGNTMAGNTINAYQARAADTLALASAAASTDSDTRGLELLRNEFKDLQAWSDGFVNARNSLSAADLTTSESRLKDDQDAQKIMSCGQFLSKMFAGGTFQDDVACH